MNLIHLQGPWPISSPVRGRCLVPADSVPFQSEWLSKPSHPGVLFVNSEFFPPTKVTLPSSKSLKLLPEAKTQKGLFSDEEDTEVRNSFSYFWELVCRYDIRNYFLIRIFSVEVHDFLLSS